MFDQEYEDRMYEMNAAEDYKREAFGDPCPRHGVPPLRRGLPEL